MRNPIKALSHRFKTWLAPVDNRGGWWPWIGEPYSGAWQNNDSWSVDTVLAYPPVYACVTLIASDIGKLLPVLMRKDEQGIWQEYESSAFSPVLRKPNNYQNHIQFKEWWIISKLIRGNTYALKERDNRGVVVKLYILEPSKVQPLVTPSGDVYYSLGGDALSGIEQESLVVPASEIIHDRINPLFHPLVGVSPLFACGESGSQGLKIIQDSARFFENGANPGGILTAPGSISDETASRLKVYWETNFTGEKRGKVAVVGDGLKFEPMRMTAVDSQLIEQLKWSAEAVCSAFHVPAYKIGVGQMPTYDNIEALTKDYYSQCLQKLIEDYELCLDDGLGLDTSKMRTELDLDGLFRMDSKTQMESLGLGVDKALMAPNEARKRLNLKPLPGGDTVYMQQQNYSLEALNERDRNNPFEKPAPVQPPVADPAEPEPEDDDIEEQAQVFAILVEKEIASELARA